MITVKPSDEKERINVYGRADAACLVMREEGVEIGFIAIAPFKSTYEILEMQLSSDKPLKRQENQDYSPLNANELGLVEILLRAAGSYAVNKESWSLCVRDRDYFRLLKKFEFIPSGEFLVLYLNKLFSNTCCCNAKKENK